jgi:MFS family permease
MSNWIVAAGVLLIIAFYFLLRTFLVRFLRKRAEQKIRARDEPDTLVEALAARQVGFLLFGIATAVALVIAVVNPLPPLVDWSARILNLMTVVMFLVAGGVVLLSIPIYRPSSYERAYARKQAAGKRLPLSRVAKGLAGFAPAIAFQPVLFGYLLTLLSGEAWRFLIFVPLSLLAAYITLKKSSECLQALATSDVFRETDPPE